MGSSNRVAAYFRRKAMIERERAASGIGSEEAALRLELATLYAERAREAERLPADEELLTLML